MDFRLISGSEEEERVKALWAYCFENEDDPFYHWYFARYYKPENTLGGYERGRMVSCLQLIPYNIFLRGRVIPVSYIVGVATYPEARRGGIVKKLLAAALEEMRRRGHYVSILMPFKAGFYYPYQWELCYHHYRYNLPLDDLRNIAAGGGNFSPVKGKEAIGKLQEVYRRFVADKHGYVVRGEMNWGHLLEEHFLEKGFIYLLEDGGRAAGYLMYFLKDKRMIVREMAYTNPQAQRAIFQFLYNHRSQAEVLEWNAPMDDLTYFLLPDPKKEIRLFPFMTGRIVDVAAALAAVDYPPAVNAALTVEVTDELAPWNNQTFALEIARGKGQAEKLGEQAGEVQCTVGALSQLIFGRLEARELQKLGRLKADPAKIAILGDIFPKCVNYINEYF